MCTQNPDLWTESEWLQRLFCRACRLSHCEDDAADLAHACLYAFFDHFQHYPWQHGEPLSAWGWCCQKMRSLRLDERHRAQAHPTVSLEELPEGVAAVERVEQVEEEVEVEAFLAGLPNSLRAALQLRLKGYSWEEAAQRLNRKASTLRGYLPALRAKFVEFFGIDPSNRWESKMGQTSSKYPLSTLMIKPSVG